MKSDAVLTIRDLPGMDKRTKRLLVSWLRHKAEEFERCDPSEYGKNYRARLMK